MHGKNIPPMEVSCSYLSSYLNSIWHLDTMSTSEVINGKTLVFVEASLKVDKTKLLPQPWPLPPPGWVPLSVDGSYCQRDGSAGSGMILRDDQGAVIFVAYNGIFYCNDVLEEELHAIMEGVSLRI